MLLRDSFGESIHTHLLFIGVGLLCNSISSLLRKDTTTRTRGGIVYDLRFTNVNKFTRCMPAVHRELITTNVCV